MQKNATSTSNEMKVLSFDRKDKDLHTRRQELLLLKKSLKDSTNEIAFHTFSMNHEQKLVFIQLKRFQKSCIIIEEEDLEYVQQFHWYASEKNDTENGKTFVVLKTLLLDSDKKTEYDLRQILVGGRLGRSKFYMGYKNDIKEDNRLKNLGEFMREVHELKLKKEGNAQSLRCTFKVPPFDMTLSREYTEIKEYLDQQFHFSSVYTGKNHRFTRKKCPSASMLEPMSKNTGRNFFTKDAIHYQGKKYRVGILPQKEVELSQTKTYKWQEIAEKFVSPDTPKTFLIDEEDFHNIKKRNWQSNFTCGKNQFEEKNNQGTKKKEKVGSKEKDKCDANQLKRNGLIYVRSQTADSTITMQDFVTCRFLNKHKEDEYWTIDHINRIRTDNRLANLRLASRNLQQQNRASSKIVEDVEQKTLQEDYLKIMEMAKKPEVEYKTFSRPAAEEPLDLKEHSRLNDEWNDDYEAFKK